MTTLDLGPTQLDIVNITQGDAHEVQFTFDIDLTGFTDWDARALLSGTSATVALTVDDSDQGTGVIVVSLPDTLTATLVSAEWDLTVTDPDGNDKTLFAGNLTAKAGLS